jgi:hypothetical protein
VELLPVEKLPAEAMTLDVAVDRRAWCRVEVEGAMGPLRLESKDTLRRLEAATVADLVAQAPADPAVWILQALDASGGLRVVTQAKVPESVGLASRSSLALCIAAAAAHALGRELSSEALVALAADALAKATGAAAPLHDLETARLGGVVASRFIEGWFGATALVADAGRIQECLVAVDVGVPYRPAVEPWTAAAHAESAAIARLMCEALMSGRSEEMAGLFAAEASLRQRLAPSAPARLEAAKPCGTGEGGLLLLWAAPGERGPGPREALEAQLKSSGLRILPLRVDLRGLEVETAL